MGVSGNFYVVNVEKLQNTLQTIGNHSLLKALESKQWQEIIYYLIDLDKHQTLEGFEEIPKKGQFNRTNTQTISCFLDDKTNETHKKYSAGHFIAKTNLLPYLDFMLGLCKYFYETKTEETIWELYDLEISEENLEEIKYWYELQQQYPPNHDKSYVIDIGDLAYKWKIFYKLKNQHLRGEIDFLVFYYSY